MFHRRIPDQPLKKKGQHGAGLTVTPSSQNYIKSILDTDALSHSGMNTDRLVTPWQLFQDKKRPARRLVFLIHEMLLRN